ncbi:MAG: ABC transporter permease, partial [Eggerthellaceae bacterium]|nr:ABC transporter permease [Eggerthellaceae bacterium]
INQINIMTDMFAEVKNNDLVAFKAYLDSDESGIDEYVNLIQYGYGLEPQVYKMDTEDGIVQLNPSAMNSMLSSGFASSAFTLGSGGLNSFNEMIDNQDILDQQYEVVLGNWPQNYDEAVFVLGGEGQITDYTLYGLGIYDPKVMEEMTRQALEGEEVVVHDDYKEFTYDDAMNMTFSVVPASSIYQKNEEQGTWTDMSGDKEFMRQAIEDGVQLKIVGVVQPTDNNGILPEGVAYPSSLTKHLMGIAAESQIVQEQLADKDVDVFTGKTFEELQDEEADVFDMESIFEIDEDALANAFSFDTSALSSMGSGMSLDSDSLGLDASSMNVDPSAFQVDPSVMEQIFSTENMAQIMAGAPPFEFNGAAYGLDMGSGQQAADAAAAQAANAATGDAAAQAAAQEAMDAAAVQAESAQQPTTSEAPSIPDSPTMPDASADALSGVGQGEAPAPGNAGLTEEQIQVINDGANQLAAGFVAWAGPERLADPDQDFTALYQQYLSEDPAAQQVVAGMNENLSGSVEQIVNQAMQDYLTNQFAPYMASAMQTLMTQAAQAMAIQMAQAMTEQISAMTDSMGSALSAAISGELGGSMEQLAAAMQDGFSFDAEAFADAIHFNMTQEDLTSLLYNYMNADELGYDANLSKLGYATLDNPETISIYPKDFVAKESVLDIIDAYNDSVTVGDDDTKAINYTDIAGVLMSSVNDIVNMISLVLIAFVSISLVVSSIMIGIITYISVLERKKEIGILRAIGASKGNIANVFNAETFIEGLIAGLFAIAVVQLVSLPVNAIVLASHNVDHVMNLPWSSAGILVAISVLLTFIAGLIPSTAASRRDPVEALRSE